MAKKGDLSITVEGKEYSLNPQDLTLDQGALLAKEFGIDSMGEMNFMEFSKAIGIVTVALTADHTLEEAKVLAGKITYAEILANADDDEDEQGKQDPTPAADAGGESKTTGNRATRRAKGGRRK